LLGHTKLESTARYLGLEVDFISVQLRLRFKTSNTAQQSCTITPPYLGMIPIDSIASVPLNL
jgi:hypothetical protein